MAPKAKHALVLPLLCLTLLLTGCGSPEQKEARHIKRGTDLLKANKFDKARVEFLNAAKIKPTDPAPVYNLALIDEAQGSLRDAFTGFQHANQQDAHYQPALLKLAEYYMVAE